MIGEKKLKAIALDVDGTLTDKNRKICLNAVKAIRQAEDRGIPVIIVTGNIMCATKTMAILFGTSGGLVAENGGVIESHGKIQVLGNIEECQRAYKFLRSRHKVKKVEFSDQRISEVAVERNIEEELVKDILRDFNVEVYDTKFAIHLTDPTVDKGSSLEILATDMGISMDEILAIGDSENDIEFLRVVGMKVAVNNADEELKALADYVTKNSYGDGVVEAIEKFMLK